MCNCAVHAYTSFVASTVESVCTWIKDDPPGLNASSHGSLSLSLKLLSNFQAGVSVVSQMLHCLGVASHVHQNVGHTQLCHLSHNIVSLVNAWLELSTCQQQQIGCVVSRMCCIQGLLPFAHKGCCPLHRWAGALCTDGLVPFAQMGWCPLHRWAGALCTGGLLPFAQVGCCPSHTRAGALCTDGLMPFAYWGWYPLHTKGGALHTGAGALCLAQQ